MTIACIVGSYGSRTWKTLARNRALPSTVGQGINEVIDVHLDDGTLAQARNEGARRARADWLLYLDADDELAPGFVDAMRAAIEAEPTRPALFTPAVCYARGTVRPTPKIWPRMDFKVGNWCIIGTLIERSLFHALGGFREYLLYEDYALWAMASEAGAEVFEVPDAVYIAHHGRLSRNRSRPRERFFWHQRIGHDIWPDHFEATTAEEDETHILDTNHLRFK
jgi:glycosyltransferase involved in cell wall biosynthesis